jgi:potassium efflux system protein
MLPVFVYNCISTVTFKRYRHIFMIRNSYTSIINRSFLFVLFISSFISSNEVLAQKKNTKAADKNNDMAYLADSTLLNRGDYYMKLEKVFETINQVKVVTTGFTKLPSIQKHLSQDESAIKLLKERLSQSDRSLNLQNLQMYQTLLDELETNNMDCLNDLKEYDASLNEMKTQVLKLRKDSVLIRIFTVDSLRTIFSSQLLEIRGKKVVMDSLFKANTNMINTLQARTSSNIINVKELMYLTNSQLKSISIRAFGKEKRYLWEPASTSGRRSVGFKRFINSEQKISQFYFVYTRSSRMLLLVIGLIFFSWVYFNYRSIAQRNKLESLEPFHFQFLRPKPYLITFIFIFTLAPVFDMLAPALYVEMVHIILAIAITILLFKRLPKPVFYKWCIFVLLLIAPVVLRLLGMPPRYQRWLLLFFSIASAGFGIVVYAKLKKMATQHRVLFTVGIIYILFNLLAIICNLFGRFTLTQIFYTTAVGALMHAVSLMIFAGSITEAFLLQIKGTRIRKSYPEHFDWEIVVKSVRGMLSIVAFLIWATLFLVNLNIFNELYESILAVLTEKRTIGSLDFTLGGLVLFLFIIWVANFLQKYIAYFFGDTGDDSLDDNKGERSKLIVTRLVLLIGGFLLAVAASGLPIDKITVVLGALGVGIGLGLQNIVSNFVSGIILIFDKTLRIGDTVELSDKKGRVKEIGIRASTLLTDDGAEIIIPNGTILSNNIINWTLTNNQMRVLIQFDLVKPFPKDEVIDMIREIIQADDNIFLNKEPKIIISPKNKTTNNIKIYFWCKDISMAEITRSSINAAIFDQLEEKEIEVA